MKRVSPKEAKALMEDGWTYLDVRSEPEFQAGHPAGALNIPLLNAGPVGLSPNPDFVRVVTSVFATDAKIVVGCKSGGRSLNAAGILERSGYASIVDQRCGFGGARDAQGQVIERGWLDENLPVETGRPAGRAYEYLLKK